MSSIYFYLTGNDNSVNRNVDVADAYYFNNPAPTSLDNINNFYTNNAEGLGFGVPDSIAQYLTGSTFSDNLSAPLIYKNVNTINFSKVYSQYNTFNFILSGIEDSNNNIIRIEFQPNQGPITVVNYDPEPITNFDGEYVYSLLIGKNILSKNPKGKIYSTNYNLNSLNNYNSISSFNPKFSAYRQDGLVDVYDLTINVSKDSVQNIASNINLLESQILPLSSLDPLIKLELDSPDYVNNAVIRRKVTPTPTRTLTPTPTIFATPTRTKTSTQTRTRSVTVTRTLTKSQTRTPTPTTTITRTRSQTPTPGVSKTRTPTRTKTQTRTPIGGTLPPTPTPSKSFECLSEEVNCNFTGVNDKALPKNCYFDLYYETDVDGNIKTLASKQADKLYGTYDLKFYLRKGLSINNYKVDIRFIGDDPGITVNNITVTDTCSNKPIDIFKPRVNPNPNPNPIVPPPTPSPSLSSETQPTLVDPVPKTPQKYIQYVFYPGMALQDEIPTYVEESGTNCSREYSVHIFLRACSDIEGTNEEIFNGPGVGKGDYLYTGNLTGMTEATQMDQPLYINVPVNENEEVVNNYVAKIVVEATPTSNDPILQGENDEKIGPCQFGRLSYTNYDLFAGPSNTQFDNFNVIDKLDWEDNGGFFTLFIGQS